MNNSLNAFFDNELEKENGNKILLIDNHNLFHRCLFVANAECPEDIEFNYWKHLVTNNIFQSIKYFNPNKVIFASDSHSKSYWRKEIYPEYKGQRKELKEKSSIDFDKFYAMLNVFTKEFREAFTNCYYLEISRCEADDIIAIISKKIHHNDQVIVITSDNDMVQLMTNPNVKIHDPIKKAFKKSVNPKIDLEIKILTGDSGDNIDNVKRRLGEKTAIKILNEGLDKFLDETEKKAKEITDYYQVNGEESTIKKFKIKDADNLKDVLSDVDIKCKYNRNRQLIDFDYIPNEISDVIINTYNQYAIQKYNPQNVWSFLLKNKMKKLAEDLQQYSNYLGKLS